MQLKIEGQHIIAAPRDLVWAAMMENGRFTQTASHYQLLESLEDNQFHGILSVQVGPLRGEHRLTTHFSQVDPATGFTIRFDGSGELGTFAGNGRVHLDAHDQNTTLHYKGNITVTGSLAELPTRLLHANINAIIRRTIEGIRLILWPEPQTVGLPPTSNSWPKESRPYLIASLFSVATIITLIFIGKRTIPKKPKSSA